jgi:GNAT superfamily N-acetyltransferase
MTWQGKYYSALICNSEADLENQYHFSHDEGGFDFYRSQIPALGIWPMAVLDEVVVPPRMRRQGLGTAAIQHFIDSARSKGARLAFLRVGWTGDLSERDKLVSWYQRRGWTPLKIPPVEGLLVPFMFQELT